MAKVIISNLPELVVAQDIKSMLGRYCEVADLEVNKGWVIATIASQIEAEGAALALNNSILAERIIRADVLSGDGKGGGKTRVYARHPFCYDGKELEPGCIFDLGGYRNDAKLIGLRVLKVFMGEPVTCPDCKGQYASKAYLSAHKCPGKVVVNA